MLPASVSHSSKEKYLQEWGLAENNSYSIYLFINDSDSMSIDYVAPGGGTVSLAANSFAYYLDDNLLLTDGLENGALTGDNTLGRMGVDSFSSHLGVDYTVDNFVVALIPEPGTFSLMMMGSVGLLFIRKRLRK